MCKQWLSALDRWYWVVLKNVRLCSQIEPKGLQVRQQ